MPRSARSGYPTTCSTGETASPRAGPWLAYALARYPDKLCGHELLSNTFPNPAEQAVLFRAAHHSEVLEVELARRNIPFVKYGGLKFLECAHVKDALAVLRICENPRDEVSWFRVLQLLDGVGPATARRLMTSLRVEDGGASRRLAEGGLVDVPATARRELDALREVVCTCAATHPPPPAPARAR